MYLSSWFFPNSCHASLTLDIDDDKLIKTMIALSDAKKDWEEGDVKYWSDDQEEQGEEDMEICENEEEPVADQPDNVMQNYAFSWDSYANNPWAPTGVSKKKASGVASDKSSTMSDLKIKGTVPDRLNKTDNTDDSRIDDLKPVELATGSVGPADVETATSLPPVDTDNEGLSLAGDFVTEEAKASVLNENITTEDNDLRPSINAKDDKNSLVADTKSTVDSITPVTSSDTKVSVVAESVTAPAVTTMENAETSVSAKDTEVKIEATESAVSIECTKPSGTNAETAEPTNEETKASVASTDASENPATGAEPSESIKTEEGEWKTNSDDSSKISANVSEPTADTDTKRDEKSKSDKTENEPTKKYTAADFPISKDGSCPHCKSTDVIYIVVTNKSHNVKLPPVLQKLLKYKLAYKLARRGLSCIESFYFTE